MRLSLLVVGKPRDHALAAAIAEYEARAARYWPLVVNEVREEAGRIETSVVRKREGERLLAQAENQDVVLCDAGGEQMTSAAFADWLQKVRERARDTAIIIGGANGVDDAVRSRATRLLALAPWTLPHELARLVLAEQLYRAGTILRGEPYHK